MNKLLILIILNNNKNKIFSVKNSSKLIKKNHILALLSRTNQFYLCIRFYYYTILDWSNE